MDTTQSNKQTPVNLSHGTRKNKGDNADLMSFGLAPPPTPLQLSHRGKKDEEREEMEEEVVIDIMAGLLKVETFSTTKKHGFLHHHFCSAQILLPAFHRSKIVQHPLNMILKIIWSVILRIRSNIFLSCDLSYRFKYI